MREQMLEYGFDVHPISDGQFHRFKGPEDKKPNRWYIFHGDHGAFGNWKTNRTQAYVPSFHPPVFDNGFERKKNCLSHIHQVLHTSPRKIANALLLVTGLAVAI